MKQIELSQGYVALVDDEDFEKVNQFNWAAKQTLRKDGSVCNVYAVGHMKLQTTIQMHRFILGITDPTIEVDHEDHKGLNNQRYNLRIATPHQNQGNQVLRSDNMSGFKGVRYRQRDTKWQAQIGKERQSLGSFHFATDAAKAYDTAAIARFGDFALTNASLGLLPA